MPPKKKTVKSTPAKPMPVKAVVPKQHRTFVGEVVSTHEMKTIRVVVRTINMHPKYHKQYTTVRKYPVHDETGKAKVGDMVEFEECRPMSKNKRWRLIQVTKK